MPEAPTHLLYLHGFRSSPKSFKAQRLRGWLQQHRPAVHWWCPQLPPSPRAAVALVLEGIAGWPGSSAVVGSSLGGFYATAVAEHAGWPCVVMNPAVDPARDLAAHIGEQTAFHTPEERFFFRPEYVGELQALRLPELRHADRTLALIAQGDELLDWREMQARYAGARQHVIPGSDHALSDFDDHLPRVLRFLGLLG
ncbi:YqiA/YcfP family alpha/beta fold hydrolase [Rubrivivax sp. RP6-9]|uniref:YqiA/YcfP family alpha/beta fold hydrolase n=1 Tax=Rubrivivax sp. RP6-9 TaxID=3415750 RepID=UPI003CC556AF